MSLNDLGERYLNTADGYQRDGEVGSLIAATHMAHLWDNVCIAALLTEKRQP